jgi:hypothetical protein
VGTPGVPLRRVAVGRHGDTDGRRHAARRRDRIGVGGPPLPRPRATARRRAR